MARRVIAVIAALLLLSGCAPEETGEDPPHGPDGWAVLDEGTEIYVRLGHIRWELERECMEDKGFDVHPGQDERRLTDWRPVDREPPVLAPSVEEASQVGLGASAPKPAPSGDPADSFNDEPADYREDYLDAYSGISDRGEPSADSCVARVHEDMFGEAPAAGAWEPIPVPVAFDWTARWEMYYAIPAVVTAAAAWRECLKGKGRKAFETIDEARMHSYGIASDSKRRAFAVDVATCVDAAGWREVHTDSWQTAVDRLVTEQLPQIRSWRADLAKVLDDAEGLLSRD